MNIVQPLFLFGTRTDFASGCALLLRFILRPVGTVSAQAGGMFEQKRKWKKKKQKRLELIVFLFPLCLLQTACRSGFGQADHGVV